MRKRRGDRRPAQAIARAEALAPADVAIERLAAGGDGIGRLPDGRVIFVPLSAPGDLVRVQVTEARKRVCRGEILEVLSAGPDRVTPPCPAFGRCGGCAWQHIHYAAQITSKRAILEDALRRIGGFKTAELAAFTASPREYGYRQRARVRVEAVSVSPDVRAGEVAVGFRERASHALCPVSECPVLLPAVEDALHALSVRSAGTQGPAAGEWELAAGSEGTARAHPVSAGAREQAEGEAIFIHVAGETVRISAGVFAQANAFMLDLLVERVCAEACAPLRRREGPGEQLPAVLEQLPAVALELFAGAGLFTLPLARRLQRLGAVEAHPGAVADLRFNLAAAGLRDTSVSEARVEDALAAHSAGDELDVIVLDPPRTGLEPGAAEALAALGAARIVYLSCDPATLARDLARIVAGGACAYRLVRVEGFDLFPQTPHVEALAVLER